MYYYSKKSKNRILHTQFCFHIRRVDPDDIGWFETLSEAYAQGYRLCKHCSPIAGQFRKESKAIYDYCRDNGLAVRLDCRSISVASPSSKWKITLGSGGRLVLYHHNTHQTAQDGFSEIRGYHLQGDVSRDSVVDYLEYIVEHDYFRMLHPVYDQPGKGSLPPKKGTKRYRREQRKLKAREKRRAIRNVLNLIDALNAPTTTQAAV